MAKNHYNNAIQNINIYLRCDPLRSSVIATTGKAGGRRISISSTNEVTDENGEARFTITAKDKIGKAKVTFKSGSVKKAIIVKVVRQ